MKRSFVLVLILLAAFVIYGCGGGGGSVTPTPNPGGGNPPADNSTRSISVSGQLAYTGILQGTSGSERAGSVAPIGDAGVVLVADGAVLSAASSDATGAFTVTAEGVSKSAQLKLKVELISTDTNQKAHYYANLPFTLESSGNATADLSLSSYDTNDDGTAEGLRLMGIMNGGTFQDGLFGTDGMDMPFGGSGPHFGWMDSNDKFFDSSENLGDGSGNMNVDDPASLPPNAPPPPDGGGRMDNRIEVEGAITDINADNTTFTVDGSRTIYLNGLVFQDHGTFDVHATENTKYRGITGFGDLAVGMETLSAGKALIDDVLQANRIKTGNDNPDQQGFFAVDGGITDIIWEGDSTTNMPVSAIVTADGVLVTFDPDNGRPDFQFGTFHVAVNADTVLAGIENLGELAIGMQVAMLGPLNPDRLTAKFLVVTGNSTPPQPPPFGFSFHGKVFDKIPDKQLVGVEGYWDDIIKDPGFGNRGDWNNNPPPSGGSDGREPAQADGSGWNRGGGVPGGTDPGQGNGDTGNAGGGTIGPDQQPVQIWIKIVDDTILEGVDNYDRIQIGQDVWSEMKIDANGSVVKDDEGNPIAASFHVFRPQPPHIFGMVADVSIFEDRPQSNGTITIVPPDYMTGGGDGTTLPPLGPNDPTNPGVNQPAPLVIRVTPDTLFKGVGSLAEIELNSYAEAEFILDSNGQIVVDDAGNPIAAWVAVNGPQPPPPPVASVYGTVLEVDPSSNAANDGIVIINPFRYGMPGGNGGWVPPDGPTDPMDPNNPDGTVDEPAPVSVRVTPDTALRGAESLADIPIGAEAEAGFVINADGTIAIDEIGNPIAAWLAIYPVTPPPNFITFEGSVTDYVEGQSITVAEYVPPDQGRPSRQITFLITSETQIVSQSGIQIGDSVLIEGYQEGDPADPNGMPVYYAKYIQENENTPL